MASQYMSVFIETLTGVAFELTCSPIDTVYSVKRKIFILEDIPVQQQHLIFRQQELNNALTLLYYGICSGSTIRLVIGMLVGPASSRKVEHEVLIDMAHFVHHFRNLPGYDGVDPIVIASEDSMQFYLPEAEVENLFEDLPEPREALSATATTVCPTEEEKRTRKEENKKLKKKMQVVLTQLKISREKRESKTSIMNPERPTSRSSVPTSSADDVQESLAGLNIKDEVKNFPPICNQERSSVKEDSVSRSGASFLSTKDFSKLEVSCEVNCALSKLPIIDVKQKKRCSWCKKKIGLATTYTCRCGKEFCGPHRYAETHECTYDYKAEGQLILLKNCDIKAPKLPKI